MESSLQPLWHSEITFLNLALGKGNLQSVMRYCVAASWLGPGVGALTMFWHAAESATMRMEGVI